MLSIFEYVTNRLAEAWRSDQPTGRGHSYRCQCGRPVFFRNSLCLGCQTPLGYEPEDRQMLSLCRARSRKPGRPSARRRTRRSGVGAATSTRPPAATGWCDAQEQEPLCRSCRLNRTIPQLDDADNARWWRLIENAKRRLVAQLLSLGLPVRSKVSEDQSTA